MPGARIRLKRVLCVGILLASPRRKARKNQNRRVASHEEAAPVGPMGKKDVGRTQNGGRGPSPANKNLSRCDDIIETAPKAHAEFSLRANWRGRNVSKISVPNSFLRPGIVTGFSLMPYEASRRQICNTCAAIRCACAGSARWQGV